MNSLKRLFRIIKLMILLVAILTFHGCVRSVSEGQEVRVKVVIQIYLQDSENTNSYQPISDSESRELSKHTIIFSPKQIITSSDSLGELELEKLLSIMYWYRKGYDIHSLYSRGDCVSVINKKIDIKPASITYSSYSSATRTSNISTVQGMLINVDAILKIEKDCPEIIEVFLHLPELTWICKRDNLIPMAVVGYPKRLKYMFDNERIGSGYVIKLKQLKVKY